MKEDSISKYEEESTYACPVDERGSDYSIPGPATHYSNPEMLHPDSRKYFTGTENNNIQEFYHEEGPDAESSYTYISSDPLPLPGRNISLVKKVDDSNCTRHNGIANEIYDEPLPLAQQVISVLILMSFNLVNIAANFHGIFRHLLRTNPYLTELETMCGQR